MHLRRTTGFTAPGNAMHCPGQSRRARSRGSLVGGFGARQRSSHRAVYSSNGGIASGAGLAGNELAFEGVAFLDKPQKWAVNTPTVAPTKPPAITSLTKW